DDGARIAGLTALGDGRIGVLECDGRGGGGAGVKRVYSFAVGGFGEGSAASGSAVLEKRLVRDLLAAGDFGAGPAPARLSGLAAAGGELLIINDNSGPGGNPLETRLL